MPNWFRVPYSDVNSWLHRDGMTRKFYYCRPGSPCQNSGNCRVQWFYWKVNLLIANPIFWFHWCSNFRLVLSLWARNSCELKYGKVTSYFSHGLRKLRWCSLPSPCVEYLHRHCYRETIWFLKKNEEEEEERNGRSRLCMYKHVS